MRREEMKKLLSTFIAFAALAVTATSSWAFTSVSSQTVTAEVTMGGTAQVTVNTLNILNVTDLTPASQLGWTNIDPTALGANSWRISDQLVSLNTTITSLNGGIQLVTNNTHPSANPRFVDPTPAITTNPDSNPAGLLLVPASGVETSMALPLAWSIKESTRTVGANLGNPNVGIGAADPNNGPEDAVGNNRFQWLFIVDKNSPAIDWNGDGVIDTNEVGGVLDTQAFVDGQDYSRLMDVRGLHFGQAPEEFGGGPGTRNSYVYFQADFASALPTLAYRTNQIVVEAFTE
jgi:hypothetical protein